MRAVYRREFQRHATRLRAARAAELAEKQGKTRAQINLDMRRWRKTVLGLHGKAGLKRIALGPWYTTGPLKSSGFDDALFPEKGVDLKI